MRDEAFTQGFQVRPHYLPVLEALKEAGPGTLADAVVDAGPLTIDPVPHLLTHDEWSGLAEGLAQRLRALEAFAADAHGERRAVRAGIVPASVATSLAPPAGHAAPARWISIAGPDIVRLPGGSLAVRCDNVRRPELMAYAVQARRLLDGAIPLDAEDVEAPLRDGLLRALRAAAPARVDPHVVILGDGVRGVVDWELCALAQLLDVPLVEPYHLRRAGRALLGPDGRRVDVVWWRSARARQPLLAGADVAVVNPPGAEVADQAHAYVERLIRFFLDEEPLLASTVRRGTAWTHPTVVDGRLEPRHVELRAFVLADGVETVAVPGGISRFDGGVKDVRVLRPAA